MTRHLKEITTASDGDHSGSSIPGQATAEASRSFAARFQSEFAADFYRPIGPTLTASSVGMGTYLGECDDEEDQRYVTALVAGLGAGINLFDTAINYRCQRSERAVGQALKQAIASGVASRDEVIVCTKAGYIPLEGSPPATRDGYKSYLKSEYFDRGIIASNEVVAGGHCLKPRFLTDQVDRSRANIGVDCIDIFYLHNPEQQLDAMSRSAFLDVMRAAFRELEALVAAGKIGCYGCATWNGFRVFPANKNYLSLAELVDAAVEAGGKDHHFRVVQMPVNLAMTEGVRSPTQHDGTTNLPLVEIARNYGVSIIASASLMQSQLTHDLPSTVESLYPGLESDAQRAIAFVRSLPIASALVGMRLVQHLQENLGAARPPVPVPATRS